MAQPTSIPIIDFSAFDSNNAEQKTALVQQTARACQQSGFFQLVNHGIPLALQQDILACSAELFALPLEVKETYSKDIGGFNRGAEANSTIPLERTAGDLKEGYYFGLDLAESHPKVITKAFGLGPNKYPQHVKNPKGFRTTIDEYHTLMRDLANKILKLLCETLGVGDGWVSDYTETPIAVLRLLHYPPQAPDAPELERGIGAHTDFGALTILLQDQVGGLQVLDRATQAWIDVEPTPGALVVNLGNLMMRWTNDRYISNLHRVINKSGQERYSVPFFFSGNPDFLVKCFSQFEADGSRGTVKYAPITVGEWISGRYADTYGTSKEKAISELSAKEAASGLA